MTVTPRISLVAFEDRNQDFIFVAVPNERGRYVRTDKSVAHAACEQCGAVAGEPCKRNGGDGYGGTTHVVRRIAARKYWGSQTQDVIHKPEGKERKFIPTLRVDGSLQFVKQYEAQK